MFATIIVASTLILRVTTLLKRAYQAGSITLTDVLVAQSQLLAARDALDANHASVARAAMGVFRALGGGWNLQGQMTALEPV